jgi:hypothetical protein
VSVKTFERVAAKVPYRVEGEMLPSGAAVFTFTPSLPGRSPVISVDEDTVADIVRFADVGVKYDHEAEEMILTLDYLDEMRENEDAPEFLVGSQAVPAEFVLELVLDQVVLPCDHCEGFHFGEDVTPDDVAKLKKPVYLN